MKILVTIPCGVIRETFIPGDIVRKLESMGTVVWNETAGQFSREELKEKLAGTDVCLTGWGTPQLDRYVLEKADKLKLVAHTGGTVATLASDYLYDRGIKVISGNRIYAESVAEGVIAYMLAALRDIPHYSNEMREGRWHAENYYSEGLLNQTVGIVGFGMISMNVVRMLKPFHVRIKVYSSHIKSETLNEYGMEQASLEEVFTTCRIVSIHASQRPETYHMIGRQLLESIPDGALLVNTSRGSIIDEKALEEEIRKKRFKAILDVYEAEPLPAESKLRGLDNVILMPHMAGPTVDRRRIVTLELMKDIEGYLNGNALLYEIDKDYASFMTR